MSTYIIKIISSKQYNARVKALGESGQCMEWELRPPFVTGYNTVIPGIYVQGHVSKNDRVIFFERRVLEKLLEKTLLR